MHCIGHSRYVSLTSKIICPSISRLFVCQADIVHNVPTLPSKNALGECNPILPPTHQNSISHLHPRQLNTGPHSSTLDGANCKPGSLPSSCTPTSEDVPSSASGSSSNCVKLYCFRSLYRFDVLLGKLLYAAILIYDRYMYYF